MPRCNNRYDLLGAMGFKSSQKWSYTTHDEDPSQKHTQTRKQKCHEVAKQATQLPGCRELPRGQSQ